MTKRPVFCCSLAKKHAKFFVIALLCGGGAKRSQMKIGEVKGLTEWTTTWYIEVPLTKLVNATWMGFLAGHGNKVGYSLGIPIPPSATLLDMGV